MQVKEENLPSSKRRVTRSHIIQSAMAGLYILLAYCAMHFFHSELAIASLGASAFIVFGAPDDQSSRPRFLIGGYCIGILGGLLCSALIFLFNGRFDFPLYIPACALAVFISMLLMTASNLKHPPAVALAAALTIDPNPVVTGIAGLASIVLLCVLKKALKTWLHNL